LTGRQNPKIQNTEIYTASLAADVLSSIHALGTGSAVSDGDRIYAEKAAGGTIELTPESMRRLLAIRDKLDRQKMEANNAAIDRRYNALPGLLTPSRQPCRSRTRRGCAIPTTRPCSAHSKIPRAARPISNPCTARVRMMNSRLSDSMK
jgi:hypothetical protein